MVYYRLYFELQMYGVNKKMLCLGPLRILIRLGVTQYVYIYICIIDQLIVYVHFLSERNSVAFTISTVDNEEFEALSNYSSHIVYKS